MIVFQTKRIEIEGDLFCEIAKYFVHVGKDTYLDGLIKKIEDWEPPMFNSNFETLNNMEECMSVYNYCEKDIDMIDQKMRKLKEDFIIRIKDKLEI